MPAVTGSDRGDLEEVVGVRLEIEIQEVDARQDRPPANSVCLCSVAGMSTPTTGWSSSDVGADGQVPDELVAAYREDGRITLPAPRRRPRLPQRLHRPHGAAQPHRPGPPRARRHLHGRGHPLQRNQAHRDRHPSDSSQATGWTAAPSPAPGLRAPVVPVLWVYQHVTSLPSLPKISSRRSCGMSRVPAGR
ncbi:hypothetical protein H4W80_010649 [Nonomuraea angiospora]|uniref:Uncharacterized protein n=1 Tax=Nonomuraea angiospora TaxID=46172 RepID=A0ABR9MJ76_9ACTN|nr:hypothetical protein [Nonomuraea angiospora]